MPEHLLGEQLGKEGLRLLRLVAESEYEGRQFIVDLHIRVQSLVQIPNKLSSIWSVHAQALGNLVEDDQLSIMLVDLLTRLRLFLLSSRFSGGFTKARTYHRLLVDTRRGQGT